MNLDFLCGKKVRTPTLPVPMWEAFLFCISCYLVWGYDQQDWHKINKEQGLQSVRRAMVQHTEMRVECSGLPARRNWAKNCDRFHLLSFLLECFLSIGQAASRTIPGQLCCMKSCFGASMFFIPDDSWPCLMWGQSSIFQRHCSWHWFGLLPKQIRKIEKMMEDVLLCSVSFYSSNMATRCHKNSMWFLILQ